ncbi:MAG: hypothetical protein H6551_12295 [Chitinophagales bacterium]|nr:hypothetical protein [Chitinophagaceae bacterium]MCB9065910.1 hypothetical protein [Chitinophagales bacterium]
MANITLRAITYQYSFKCLFSVLFLTVSCFCTTKAQEEYTKVPKAITAESLGITSKVKSIYKIEYSISTAERTLDDTTHWVDTLLNKNIETTSYFNKLGYLSMKTLDSFDEKGKIEQSRTTRYYHNKDRQILALSHYIDHRFKDSIRVEYDHRHKDRVEELTYYDKKGDVVRYVEFFYRNDRIFNVKLRNPDRSLQNFIRYEYFDNGMLREKEVKGSTMQYMYSVKYEYDSIGDGNIQMNRYDYVGLYKCKQMIGKVFNSDGQMLEKTVTDSTKHVIDYRTLTYNDKGLLATEQVFAGESSSDKEYTYEFDDKGYWRTVKVSDKGTPVSKTHRVIEYRTNEEE